MSKLKTVYGAYYISSDRSWGNSDMFDTYDEALKSKVTSFNGEFYILEQTYEVEAGTEHHFTEDKIVNRGDL